MVYITTKISIINNNIKLNIVIEDIFSIIENISKSCIQCGSKQDLEPDYKIVNDKLSLIVADGHGGSNTRDFLEQNKELILNKIIENDTLTTMNFIQKLTSKCIDGAVICLTSLIYEYDNIILEITNRGDTSLILYENDEFNYINTHHKFNETTINEITTIEFLKKNGCKIIESDYTFKINKEGTHIITPCNKHFYYDNIACFGHIGNGNCSNYVPSYFKKIKLKRNKKYKIVVCTDGILDIFNIEDTFLINNNAVKICSEAFNRWNKSWYLYDNREEYKGNIHGPNKYFKDQVDDCSCITIIINT